MSTSATQFGSLASYQKGSIEIIADDPRNFAFSNIFDVANRSAPYEKVVVAKNLKYVIEAILAEGSSPWFAADHDEFVIVMDGQVEVDLVKLDDPGAIAAPGTQGAAALKGEPKGRKMGLIKLGTGHQALLPRGAAYRFRAARRSCMIQQTQLGTLSREKWADICQR